uniref:Uncharacterized protein n=1 Tax=Populus trichocarpa TaxID=3694 RepID=A0A3N7FE88_POPTR
MIEYISYLFECSNLGCDIHKRLHKTSRRTQIKTIQGP